jgi:hypothetical protein
MVRIRRNQYNYTEEIMVRIRRNQYNYTEEIMVTLWRNLYNNTEEILVSTKIYQNRYTEEIMVTIKRKQNRYTEEIMARIRRYQYDYWLCFLNTTFKPYLWYQCKLGPSWAYASWISNYLCHRCLSLLTLWVRITPLAGCNVSDMEQVGKLIKQTATA